MDSNPLLGVLLHAIGGLAAASFYIPLKKVRKWSWETYWILNGVFSWFLVPWIVALIVCPDTVAILRASDPRALGWSFFFGALWGVGAITFGLSMRYLGLSLGCSLALGFCAAFGTMMPPIFARQMGELLSALSGQVTLAGVLVCLLGIAFCGWAGVLKEREMPAEQKAASILEFDFAKGVWVAMFCGLMSACMAFGLTAGAPIAEIAAQMGTPDIWKNTPVLIVVFFGGFVTNFVWCLTMNIRNGSLRDYIHSPGAPILLNYFFAALAGFIWYLQFMFYGMGTTKMGEYEFSSWTLHMAFIIVFSNVWGIYFHEWRGAGRRTHHLIYLGIAVLIASTIVVGVGNYLGSREAATVPAAATTRH